MKFVTPSLCFIACCTGLIPFSLLSVALALDPKDQNAIAELDGVRAEIAMERGPEGYCVSQLQMTITRGGKTIIDGFLAEQLEEEAWLCWVPDLQVKDLDGDNEPEVLLDLYSGGAHCCFSSVIYDYDNQQNTYRAITHFWGNGGYRLKDLDGDGKLEFESHDDSFAYAFASYAASRYPAQIWQYRDGAMADATRQFPTVVYDNAYGLWQDYTETHTKGKTLPAEERLWIQESERATLAAYLADKYSLGEGADGWKRVQTAYQGSDRQGFFSDLRNFLQEIGYVTNSYTKRIQFAPDTHERFISGRIDQQQTQRHLVNCGEGQNFSLELKQGNVSVRIQDPSGNVIGIVDGNVEDTWAVKQLPIMSAENLSNMTPASGSTPLNFSTSNTKYMEPF